MPVVETAHQRTANTKNQILENARELFAEHGYDGTSIRQLTATLNITPAALYYHFASKNDVLEGLAAKLHDGSDDLLKRISEFDQSPKSMREALGQYSDWFTTMRLFNTALLDSDYAVKPATFTPT